MDAVGPGGVDKLAEPAISQGRAELGAGPLDGVVPKRVELLRRIARGGGELPLAGGDRANCKVPSLAACGDLNQRPLPYQAVSHDHLTLVRAGCATFIATVGVRQCPPWPGGSGTHVARSLPGLAVSPGRWARTVPLRRWGKDHGSQWWRSAGPPAHHGVHLCYWVVQCRPG
jgi:hypothetical protein